MRSTIRYRQLLATAAFVSALATVAWLGRPDTGSAGPRDAELGFQLTEVAADVGVDFVHQAPQLDPALDHIAAHVAGIGASVSVTDFDADGWPDLYFGNSRVGAPNALYHNQGDGTFLDVAADVGLADVNRAGEGVTMGSVWGDYDNDGDEDLFVYKWGYPQLFENLGGVRFRDASAGSGLRHWMNSNGAVWLDYDRDGLLDLYVANYFRSEVDLWHLETTRIMQESFEFADNGGENRLFHNLGGGRFEDVTEAVGVGSTRWSLAAASADFDEDGWPDLYVANDYGPEELFLNREGGRFELAAGMGMEDDSKSGMSVALGDVENRGRLDVFVTNISEPGYLLQGNNLRMNFIDEARAFFEVAQGPVADAGWAWGAQFGDLDNDGDVELFITNGFFSASAERDYWYGMSKIAGASGRIFEDASTWPEIGDASLSGYERSRLLWNMGTGYFIDVAERAGITDHYDGRAVAFADLFNRGALDVIVANQKGPGLIYRNTVDPTRHWIEFELRGTASNRSAIGAEVTVEAGEMRRRSVVDGGMGFCSQNDRRLHFGLGGHAGVDRVVIRWPSGQEQVIEDLEGDRLHRVIEPQPAAGATGDGTG
jgi:hypothetical protein